MITYTLKDLMRFFQVMHDTNYDGIRLSLNILSDSVMTDEEKLDDILRVLHFYGLEEYTKRGEEIIILSDPIIFRGTINPIQLFDISFTNGKIDFWQNLN